MSQSTTSVQSLFSPRASLAALAVHLKACGVFEMIRERVQIAQKTVSRTEPLVLIEVEEGR